jgi:outer membrane protein TolC
VVSQARLLFTRLTAQAALMDQLQAADTLLLNRYQRSQQALAAGNVTIAIATIDLTALQIIERQINDLQRSLLQNRASLNNWLGLAANAPLPLVGEPALTLIDADSVRTGLEQRLNQRPDLLALQAGYRSQEEKFRGAVLAQFPALNLGLTRARDTFGLYTTGLSMNLSLPVFNRNRGNIAIEDTTRKKLFDEYQGRLNSAYNEIAIALENLPLLQNQLQRTQLGVDELKTVRQHAESAYQEGNLAATDYVRLQTTFLDKQSEAINLKEALMEQQIALETLLGPDLPEQTKNRNAP